MNTPFLAGAGVRGIMPSHEMVNNSLHSCMTVRLDEQGSPLQAKGSSHEARRRNSVARSTRYSASIHRARARLAAIFQSETGPSPFGEGECERSSLWSHSIKEGF